MVSLNPLCSMFYILFPSSFLTSSSLKLGTLSFILFLCILWFGIGLEPMDAQPTCWISPNILPILQFSQIIWLMHSFNHLLIQQIFIQLLLYAK